ncbi:MAG: hypothetical protein Q4C47_08970, partial [Planctomycetia bacterium]|nr:hypothetical protein [Planctomycetia bacterium]
MSINPREPMETPRTIVGPRSSRALLWLTGGFVLLCVGYAVCCRWFTDPAVWIASRTSVSPGKSASAESVSSETVRISGTTGT